MMTRSAWVGVVIGLAALVGAYWWLYGNADVAAPYEPTSANATLPGDEPEFAEPEAEPAIAHPMPEPEPDGVALPELENSDEAAMGDARQLFGPAAIDRWIIPRELIRRAVLFVDSLDREALPMWLRPLRRVPGGFDVVTPDSGVSQEQAIQIAQANARRYAPLITMLEQVDMSALAAAYRRYYPLFQDAYARIGNPRARYFNDRLVGIIDHLLATPVVDEPIALVRPKVLYLYADPELEALSSGQKAMLRMGRENAARVQARLREFRSAITAR